MIVIISIGAVLEFFVLLMIALNYRKQVEILERISRNKNRLIENLNKQIELYEKKAKL